MLVGIRRRDIPMSDCRTVKDVLKYPTDLLLLERLEPKRHIARPFFDQTPSIIFRLIPMFALSMMKNHSFIELNDSRDY